MAASEITGSGEEEESSVLTSLTVFFGVFAGVFDSSTTFFGVWEAFAGVLGSSAVFFGVFAGGAGLFGAGEAGGVWKERGEG